MDDTSAVCAIKIIEYICDDDSRYPASLRNIKNHPIIISARGNIDTLSKKTVSIVGTRHSTAAGMNFISEIANAFVGADMVATLSRNAGSSWEFKFSNFIVNQTF